MLRDTMEWKNAAVGKTLHAGPLRTVSTIERKHSLHLSLFSYVYSEWHITTGLGSWRPSESETVINFYYICRLVVSFIVNRYWETFIIKYTL